MEVPRVLKWTGAACCLALAMNALAVAASDHNSNGRATIQPASQGERNQIASNRYFSNVRGLRSPLGPQPGSANGAGLAPRGGGSIHSGLPACDDLGVCDLQVGINGPIDQTCPLVEGDWVSLAFPVQTDGASICEVVMTHNTNTAGGHLFLLDDCGGNPDVGEVLYQGCDQIVADQVGQVTYTIDPPVTTNATTWVVAVFNSSFSFDVAYNSSVVGEGLAFGNVSGSGAPGSWLDMTTFGFGFCYCVSVNTECAGVPCCEGALCDGDANGDGTVDPLDTGFILARLGQSPEVSDNCRADVNCDGVIDPLDSGYAAARFGTCNAPVQCAPGGGECGGGGGGEPPPPPANDDCSDAIVISEGSTPFDTTLATTDGPEDCDADTGNFDIWYQYTAPSAGNLLVSTCGDIAYDGTLSLYSGTGCVGTNLGCSDDGCGVVGGGSELFIPVTANQVIKIRVGGWDDDACGNVSRGAGTLLLDHVPTGQGACCLADESCFTGTSLSCTTAGGTFQGADTACITDQCLIASNNDACNGATPQSVSIGQTVSYFGDAGGSTADCTGADEVWEAFTLTELADVEIDFCGTTSDQGQFVNIVIMDSCGPSGECGAFIFDDDSAADARTCTDASVVNLLKFSGLQPGTYYYPILGPDPNFPGIEGEYQLNVTALEPRRDCCEVHAAPGCDEIDGVPAPGVEECVCAFDEVCCTSTWDEACVAEVELFGCADCPAPQPNDECDGAVALACGDTATVFGRDYTSGANDPVSTCELANGGPFAKDTSWWYLVTTDSDTASVTLELCDSIGDADNDTVVTVFTRTSTCGALTQFRCDDDACTFPNFGPSIVTFNALPDTTYIVLVDVYSPSDDTAEYTTQVTCTP